MSNLLNDDAWVWVVVQDPGGNEHFVGQQDQEKRVSFIPAFYKKEDAQQCFPLIPKERGKKYEIQAIFFGELAKDAAKNGFMIFMLDAEAQILKKIQPIS